MLNLEVIKNTKVYQEAKDEGKQEGKLEGKLEMIPKLLEKGMSVQEVAELLELEAEVVRKAIE